MCGEACFKERAEEGWGRGVLLGHQAIMFLFFFLVYPGDMPGFDIIFAPLLLLIYLYMKNKFSQRDPELLKSLCY